MGTESPDELTRRYALRVRRDPVFFVQAGTSYEALYPERFRAWMSRRWEAGADLGEVQVMLPGQRVARPVQFEETRVPYGLMVIATCGGEALYTPSDGQMFRAVRRCLA